MSSSGFTIHHLPYGLITTPDDREPVCATAYEDYAINLKALARDGLFDKHSGGYMFVNALSQPTWNTFAELGSGTRQYFRTILKSYIQSKPNNDDKWRPIWYPLSSITLHYPMRTTNYSDFYCSHEHAQNCSAVFNLPISPTWYVLPQVYNGRTSSLALTGTPITRPQGIFPTPTPPGGQPSPPTFQAETKLDFELEMGVFVAHPCPRGARVSISSAKRDIFGIALLNDWSARSIQFYEIQPLGPFHSKGSLTSVAGWITPVEALDECALSPRHSPQQPPPLPHLTQAPEDESAATWSVHVTASVIRNGKEYLFSQSNLNELHWTPAQMLTHLSSAGEGLSSGDIFGTGTLSSARKNQNGEKIGLSCIWERQLGDAKLASLPEGVAERLLEDKDEVVFRGWVGSEDGKDVKFRLGECRGVVLPAR